MPVTLVLPMKESSDMIKLYILYTVLGFYVLYYSLLSWVFPFDGAVLQTDIALVASVILYAIAPVIALYKPQSSPVWGLICLAGISPFGFHWLQYRMMNEYFMVWKPESMLMYAAVIWYFATLIITINVYTVRQNLKVKYYSKSIKVSLALLPLTIFAALAVYFVLQ